MKHIRFFSRAKRQLGRAGFTLVELMIVMGLLSVFTITLVDIFASIAEVQSESEATSSVAQDGRYIMGRLQYDIERATSISVPEDLNIGVTGISATGATITWTTAVASNSQVEYGTTSAYGSSSTLNPGMVTAHSVSLSGLAASTTYHFRVRSVDASGELTTSTNYTFSTTGGGAITHIQTAGTTNNAGASSISQAFSGSTVTGNLIAVAVAYRAADATISCADSRGNTYAIATDTYDTTNSQGLAICYAPNVTGGSTTVTVTFSAAVTHRRILIHEYRGIVASDPVDRTATNIANATTAADNVTSAATTTTVNGDLLFGAVVDAGSTTSITAGTGFTQRNSLNAKDLATQDRTQTTAGSIASTQTFGATHRYLAHMVAFKPAQTMAATDMLGTTSRQMSLVIGGVTHTYRLVGGKLQLTNNQGTNDLNGSETVISNLSFQRIGNITGKETVQLSFTVTSVARTDRGTETKTYTSTVGRR